MGWKQGPPNVFRRRKILLNGRNLLKIRHKFPQLRKRREILGIINVIMGEHLEHHEVHEGDLFMNGNN